MTADVADIKEASPAGWRFEHSYAELHEDLSTQAAPAPFTKPELVVLNHPLAEELGLDLRGLTPEGAARLFAGQQLPGGARTIAQAYAGHQYGGFTMLGDGRAILLGEHRTPAGRLVDIQFKGAGRTRYSRGGDGLAALGPMLREYIVSEAMAALGIPTTRSLAVATTGEPVFRETVKRGAVLTRVAASHIRVGTFEYAVRRGPELLRRLADHAIARHYPDLVGAPEKHLAFLREAMRRQASLVARWQLVGFVHGVMNTDNVAISGETIDYGPCAFMNTYNPATVFSSIDRGGRYAYGNQAAIMHWNMARFAETLLPLLDDDMTRAVEKATEVLNEFPEMFDGFWLAGMRRKLGLQTESAGDLELANSLMEWMLKSRADFTNTFVSLTTGPISTDSPPADPDFAAWISRWSSRLAEEQSSIEQARQTMRTVNPSVIPRNHLVEEALAAAEDGNDLAPLHQLVEVLRSPFDPKVEHEKWQSVPPDDGCYRTFCGT